MSQSQALSAVASGTRSMSVGRQSMLWMLTFVLLWAVVEGIAGEVLRAYSPYQVVWTRYAVHLALMLLWWSWRRPGTLWRTRRPAYQLGRSLLMVGMPASYVLAMQQGVRSETLMAVFWLSPLLIMVLARVVLGERAPRPLWLAAMVATVGALLPSVGPLPSRLAMLIYPAGMALTFSLYVVMTRSLRTEPTRVNLFHTAFGVWLVLLPFISGLWIAPTPRHWVVMFLVGAVGLATLMAVDRAAALAPISLSAPLVWVQWVFTLIVGGAFGHEFPGRRVLVGAVLMVAAAGYVWVCEPVLTVRERGELNAG